jgi:hypothetical protein
MRTLIGRTLVVGGLMLCMPEGAALAQPPVEKHSKAAEVRFPVENAEKAETLSRKLIEEYLSNNVDRALLLADMQKTIERFRGLAPKFVLRKCMDGRLQGPNAKGCPETIIYFGRTHGAIADARLDNYELWNPIQLSMVGADDEHPSLFIASGHTGCSAHKKTDEPIGQTNKRALLTVQDQVHDVTLAMRKAGTQKRLLAYAALTDTNNLGMTLYRSDGSKFYDAQAVMEGGSLKKPASVFDTDFLRRKIDEDFAHASIQGKTLAELLGGDDPIAFAHGKETIALETYLLEKFTLGMKDGSLKKQPILSDYVQGHIDKAMGKEVPASTRAFLAHMLSWNTAHALYRERYLEALKAKSKDAYEQDINHNERILALGNSGFDTLRRNEVVLIKPGSFDDRRAIAIGADVLQEVYAHRKPGHYPLAHINIELENPIDTDHQLRLVLARMRTKVNVMRVVFGDEARIFTTYSYHQTVEGGPMTKTFYPLNPLPDDKGVYVPHDLMKGVDPRAFDAKALRKAETAYVDAMKKAREKK